MNYYLICKKHKKYAISGAVTDFGPSIADKDIVDFVTKAMIDNWEIELVTEKEMGELDKNHTWTEYKHWMK